MSVQRKQKEKTKKKYCKRNFAGAAQHSPLLTLRIHHTYYGKANRLPATAKVRKYVEMSFFLLHFSLLYRICMRGARAKYKTIPISRCSHRSIIRNAIPYPGKDTHIIQIDRRFFSLLTGLICKCIFSTRSNIL